MINFNGRTEYGVVGYTPQGTAALTMKDRTIGTPPKTKIKISVPFMSGVLDFSTIGSMDNLVYQQRKITLIISLFGTSKEDLFNKYRLTMSWLKDAPKSQLIFDDDKDFYYMAEIEDTDSSEMTENYTYGEFTIVFVADPYKYLRNNQPITVTSAISINNPYAVCTPSIRVYGTGAGNLIVNGQTVALNVDGYTDVNYLFLNSGINNISFNGSITSLQITPNFRSL